MTASLGVAGGVPAERPWLAGIEAKIGGTSDRPPWALRVQGSVLLLDRNENRDPALAEFIRGLVAELPASVMTDYGDPEPLREKLAGDLGVAASQVMFAPGSEASIRDVFAAFVGPGDAVVCPFPTFIMVPVYCRQFGAEMLGVDYRPTPHGPSLDLDAFCDRIAARRPRLVYLPNPNSPTGTILDASDLRRVIEAAAAVGAVCLIDEAYYPFHDFTTVSWVDDHPNLLVARTFSKAWGMAGLRLGMLVGGAGIMSVMAKLKPLNEAAALTLAVAHRLADHRDRISESVRRLSEGKESFCTGMDRLGFRVHRGFGNFCLVDFGAADAKIMQAMEGIAVFRRVAHPSMAGMQRITATTKEIFAPVVEKIAAAMAG